MIGYMVTWTTYGTWLQGDRRGYVKKGQVCPEDDALRHANEKKLKTAPAELGHRERQIVRHAILTEARNLGQQVHALAVCSNHAHIVAQRISESIETVVSHYKNAARLALHENGFVGRVWTRGFDKRFCFTREDLENRIRYVRAHNKDAV
jgi:hypothetical protein